DPAPGLVHPCQADAQRRGTLIAAALVDHHGSACVEEHAVADLVRATELETAGLLAAIARLAKHRERLGIVARTAAPGRVHRPEPGAATWMTRDTALLVQRVRDRIL